MKATSQYLSAFAAFVLLAAPAVADDAVAAGKIKGINAEKKEFVLTDSAGKDSTFKLGESIVINRGGNESLTDLKSGDAVNVCYDKGTFTWTAHYILVQTGETENCRLMHGTVRSYDADKKQLTFTDQDGKDWNYPMGSARVRVNRVDAKIADLKIGDRAMAIVERTGEGETTLRSLIIVRE